jgi:signal peptidase I
VARQQQTPTKASVTKAPAKAVGKRAPAKKAPAKRAPAKKAPATRAPAKKAPAKRAPAKKAAAAAPPAPVRTLVAAPEPWHRRWRWLLELPILLVTAIVVTLIVKALLAQAFYIPSASMEPQLREGDRVVVSRTAYHLHDVHRGDIVVFPSPAVPAEDENFVEVVVHDVLEAVALRDPGDRELIKRVIGLPGEVIEGRNSRVVIDGQVLQEPYLPPGVITTDFGPITVPEGHVFVMGDNRTNSHDSRFSDIGPIDVDSIVGRAIARVWPPGRTAFL